MEASMLADLNERLYNRETAQIHITYLQFPSPESSDIWLFLSVCSKLI